ncbi:hypothetical protein AXG93_4142s1240 [Marchantia polymorpha subsp. ruderalis]|uniref:Uncharacterized protein n=1 Tax=Marchantia polymorpha subsp. ruderalis TaxID=1480154 RepID=A0A176WLX6_MARPO|nr:hypothetical protein AXG93_4142s1240 [Marchantia polymorpha subsp. ruderalis]
MPDRLTYRLTGPHISRTVAKPKREAGREDLSQACKREAGRETQGQGSAPSRSPKSAVVYPGFCHLRIAEVVLRHEDLVVGAWFAASRHNRQSASRHVSPLRFSRAKMAMTWKIRRPRSARVDTSMHKEREKQEKHTVTVEAYEKEKETDSEVAALQHKLTALKQEVAEFFHLLDD